MALLIAIQIIDIVFAVGYCDTNEKNHLQSGRLEDAESNAHCHRPFDPSQDRAICGGADEPDQQCQGVERRDWLSSSPHWRLAGDFFGNRRSHRRH